MYYILVYEKDWREMLPCTRYPQDACGLFLESPMNSEENVCFVLFRFASFRFALFCFVSVRFGSARFGSVRFGSFCFVLFCFVSFRFSCEDIRLRNYTDKHKLEVHKH